ncbi:hypothetical protein HU200_009090 [Digitaria exilis]|uniref:Aspergillus nuclease S1 n=1 Tax=Digitaria exilis TaxID=1010633 RepID=A0A835FLJ9_9POAL|nr:hypothetical protein HU200_009090 [Digitaria exilis]
MVEVRKGSLVAKQGQDTNMGLHLVLHVLLVAVVARAPAAHAWGKDGHYMVCKIAERPRRKDLLPGWAGGDLAETCSWADSLRSQYPWSSPLHYADTPGDCKFSYASEALLLCSENLSSFTPFHSPRACRFAGEWLAWEA